MSCGFDLVLGRKTSEMCAAHWPFQNSEEDPVAAVEENGVETEVVTQVPGVVRELYIEPGRPVRAGDVIAAIDES